MVKCSRRSLSLSDLWVSSHEKLNDFYVSSWQRSESPMPLLAIRLVMAALATGILIWSLTSGLDGYWLIYLTNWGLMLITLMTISGLIVSVMVVCTNVTDGVELPWYVSMYWFIFNISISIAFIITALYWILLYDPESEEQTSGDFWMDVATHGFNSCIAIVELLSSRTPVRLLHIYQPLGVGLWYAAFTAIYYSAGGTDSDGNPFIYEILDWRQADRAGIVLSASMAGLILVYIVIWGLALSRDKLSLAIVRTTSHNLASSPYDVHTRIV